MTIVITGSEGFIGSNLVPFFNSVIVDRVDLKIHKNILIYQPARCKLVIHLAAKPGVRGSFETPEPYIENNILGTVRVFEWARYFGCPVIYASSSSVHGQDGYLHSVYAMTKQAQEKIAQAYFIKYGVPSIGLRFYTVYGPNGRKDMAVRKFIEAAMANEDIYINGTGQQARDFTYVKDVCNIIRDLSTEDNGVHGCKVLDLGAGKPIRLQDVAEYIIREVGSKSSIHHKPALKEDVFVTRAEDGYPFPYTGFRQGMGETLAWHRENCRNVI